MNSYPHEPQNKWDRDKSPTALQLHDTCFSSAERRERKQQSSVIGAWEQNNKTANRYSLQNKDQGRKSSRNCEEFVSATPSHKQDWTTWSRERLLTPTTDPAGLPSTFCDRNPHLGETTGRKVKIEQERNNREKEKKKKKVQINSQKAHYHILKQHKNNRRGSSVKYINFPKSCLRKIHFL